MGAIVTDVYEDTRRLMSGVFEIDARLLGEGWPRGRILMER